MSLRLHNELARKERPPRFSIAFFLLLAAVLLLGPGCGIHAPQTYRSFITQTPLPQNEYLIIGFMGGHEAWDYDRRPVRRMALQLRALNLPGVHVETVENKRRELALELVRNAFDRNGDGKLDAQELANARVILYGYSFGGAAVVKLARQLKETGVPVLLTVQVDSVGLDDQVIPSNVARAANFYQQKGLIIRGQANIRAEDATKTAILGNFKYKFENKKISDADFYWLERIVASSHTKMGSDPTVWAQVERLIRNEVK